MTTLKIRATQPQAEFHQLKCRYPAFIAGYGAGKSEAMVNQAILDASHSPDAVIALYAPTYDLIRLITAPRLIQKLEELGIEHRYNKSENKVYCVEPFGDFILRTLDNPARIVGYESYRAHIDEIDTLDEAKAADVWNKVIGRNRQKPSGLDEVVNRVSVYSTPEGYKFVYKRWHKENNSEYELVKASSYSNPYLPDNYIDSLKKTYPAALVDAYIYGDFVNMTTGTVYRSYDRAKHHSNETVKDIDTLYIGMDFNIDDMAATIYVRRGPTWHAVDEITKGYNTVSVAETIRQRYPHQKVIIYPDASGANRNRVGTGAASESDIAVLKQSKYGFEVRYRQQNPRVRDRINATNAAFDKDLIFINSHKCPQVAECLEQQAYDKNGEPDKKSGVDHQNDATTYPIAYEMPIRKPVAAIEVGYAV